MKKIFLILAVFSALTSSIFAKTKKSEKKSDKIKIRYGINLLDVTQELNIQETYTSILPYYKKDYIQKQMVTNSTVIILQAMAF